jgi:predicted acetyltransferase
LYPFRVAFYARLGYGDAGVAVQWQVPPRALPDAPERRQVVLLDAADERAAAHALYGRWAATQTGQLERTQRVWAELCTQPDRALVGYRAPDGDLEGYALVTYRPDLPRASRYLEVDELVWTTTAARRGLYAWLASLGDQWDQLLIRSLPSHRLGDWLAEPRLPLDAAPSWGLWAPAATQLMGPMFRLLDVETALKRRRTADAAPVTIGLDVADRQLPGNAGRWTLAIEGGRIAVARTGSAPATLRLDIATLSRLYIGALSPSAGVAAGLIECDRPDVLVTLDAALALPEPWTFDRF